MHIIFNLFVFFSHLYLDVQYLGIHTVLFQFFIQPFILHQTSLMFSWCCIISFILYINKGDTHLQRLTTVFGYVNITDFNPLSKEERVVQTQIKTILKTLTSCSTKFEILVWFRLALWFCSHFATSNFNVMYSAGFYL